MLGDIDLIFGIWVYNDELQIKFRCRSGGNSSLCPHIPKIGSISQIVVKNKWWQLNMRQHFKTQRWVYNDEIQIKFTCRSGPWTFGQIFSCHHFISLWFEIFTWFLVWECIIISYRSTLKFIPVEWFLANLHWAYISNHSEIKVVTTKYLAKFQSPRAITRPKIIEPERNVNLICNSSLYTHVFLTYSVTHVRISEMKQLWPLFIAMLWDIDLIFGMWVYNDKLQIKFMFRSGPMILGRVMALHKNKTKQNKQNPEIPTHQFSRNF
jgi:hypothetical protein